MAIGDFSVIKNHNKKIGGTICRDAYSEDFNRCCKEVKIEDLRYMGRFFIWSICRERDRFIACKLDRALIIMGGSLNSLILLPPF